MQGFAVIGCTKCRRKMVADLSYETKTCQCGNRIDLKKTRILAGAATAAEAAALLRAMNSEANSGFTCAQNIRK